MPDKFILYLIAFIVGVLVLLVIGFVFGIGYRKRVAEREIGSAEDEAKRIINESIKSAEAKKREALVEAREEIILNRAEYEKEEKERRGEIQKQERRLQQKEESIDRKTEGLERRQESLNKKLSNVESEIASVQKLKEEQIARARGNLGLQHRRGQGVSAPKH
jgi:ribonuclease Y